jgi:hypothetical protein
MPASFIFWRDKKEDINDKNILSITLTTGSLSDLTYLSIKRNEVQFGDSIILASELMGSEINDKKHLSMKLHQLIR